MLNPLGGLGRHLVDALPPHLKVRPATPFDAISLARNIRPADGAEIMAWGYSPENGTALSVALADDVWAVEGAEGVIALFGCREIEPGVGQPWLLIGTPMLRHPKAILTFGKAMVARWNAHWPLLVTWSWIAHERHHAWLRKLGFTPVQIVPTGATSALCYEFVRINPHGP